MAKKSIIQTEVQYYLNHISGYDREFAKWEGRVTKIIKRYRDDGRNVREGQSKYNILWSMVQTLRSATFARLPKPDVQRRFKDNDPVGRVAALMLERALDYEVEHYPDYRETLTSCVYDRFLGGRGVAWVRYEPKFKPVDGLAEEAGEQITEDVGEGEESQTDEAGEVIDYECTPTDYVHWKDFGHSVARTWEEVTMVWRKVYMTRAMLRERFPEIADSIPLDAEPDELKSASKEGVDKRALIYEIWDKETGKAVWLSKSMGKILDEKDDPLGLETFFPCPKPIFATITNESLVPIPDFSLYQDQANELDTLSDRIDGLIKALQVKGVYNASEPTLARLFTEGVNGSLLPVTNWTAFAEKAGLQGAIDMVDLAPIASALREAYVAMEQVKQQIYDITGISDIIRGQSVASETATAQQIKGQYASLRLKSYQDDVSRFAGQMLQLKAQIICNHFDDQTILMISAANQLSPQDQQYIPQALQLLRDEPMRGFRIDIVADSMILMDEQTEKQNRMEFLMAVSGFLDKAVQAGQAAPQMTPLLVDLLKFGVAGFRAGKNVEGAIEQFGDQAREQAAQPQQNKPSEAEIKAQVEQGKIQAQGQLEQMKAQAMAQIEQMKMAHDQQLEIIRQQAEMQRQNQQMAFEQWKTTLVEETKRIVAEMAAQTAISAQQDRAAEASIRNQQ